MKWMSAALLLLLLLPGRAAAQTAWDSPLLLPPRPADGLGIFLTEMYAGGVGVMGMWRSPVWNYGVRGGISAGPRGDDLAVFGGVDYSGPVHNATADLPIDIDWVFGAGLGLSDGARVSVPLGLSAAYSIQTENARFTPFITPRVGLDLFFGNEDRPPDSSRVGMFVAADIGLDLRLAAGTGPIDGATIRFAASVGRSAIGIGVLF
jgi:hypothetical protein